MTPTNVLLTCAGMRGDMVVAFQAALAREGAGGVVVAADASRSRRRSTWPIAARSSRAVGAPGYVASLLALCEQHAIRAVLPLTDLDQSILTARRDDFAAVGATVVASDPETCDLSVDKYAAHCFFERHGIGSPATWLPEELPDELPFPVLVKARRGFAARHIYRAHDAGRARVLPALHDRASRWCRRSARARSSRSTSSATSRAAASRPCRAR